MFGFPLQQIKPWAKFIAQMSGGQSQLNMHVLYNSINLIIALKFKSPISYFIFLRHFSAKNSILKEIYMK